MGTLRGEGWENGLAIHVPLDTPKVVVEGVVKFQQGRPVIRDVTGLGRQEQDHPDREEEEDGGVVRRMLRAQCWWIRSKDRMPRNRRMEARSRGTELAPVGLRREYKKCCGMGEESKGGSFLLAMG